MKTQVNPKDTSRAEAFELWMSSPMPMVTLTKTFDVSRLCRYAKKHGVKFNMLLCWCIGKAASQVPEFIEELRKLLAELWGHEVPESIGMFPPFGTDCGKNTWVGERTFINMGCKFQDQGGIFIGNDCLIGHNATL